jgi:hypothetical protein
MSQTDLLNSFVSRASKTRPEVNERDVSSGLCHGPAGNRRVLGRRDCLRGFALKHPSGRPISVLERAESPAQSSSRATRNRAATCGYAELRRKTEGRLFAGPRFVISRSRVQLPPGSPTLHGLVLHGFARRLTAPGV